MPPDQTNTNSSFFFDFTEYIWMYLNKFWVICRLRTTTTYISLKEETEK